LELARLNKRLGTHVTTALNSVARSIYQMTLTSKKSHALFTNTHDYLTLNIMGFGKTNVRKDVNLRKYEIR